MAAARDLYFAHNGFGPTGGYDDAWVDFKLGPIPLPFPNTAGRVRAVRFHDLHHVLTGYATDTLGEFEISAWEVGSGCADHWAAWQLNLAGTVAGLLAIPRRTVRAFVRGRRSGNLYRRRYDAALLEQTVGALRTELGLGAKTTASPATPGDLARLAGYALVGAVIGTVGAAALVPLALTVNAAAWWRRGRARTVA